MLAPVPWRVPVQLRTRLATLVIALIVVVAALATCRQRVSLTNVSAPPDVASDADVAPARRIRHRATRPVARVGKTPSPVLDTSSSRVIDRSEVLTWPQDSPSRAKAQPTGRVHVLMLKNGRPFAGGHICFYDEAQFVAPAPWDGATSSDYAYAGLPMYVSMWPHFDPVLRSGGSVSGFTRERGITGVDGTLSIDVPADRPLVLFVRYAMSGIPLVSHPHVALREGEEVSVTIEAARIRKLTGRCVDERGNPLPNMLVQAVAPFAESPLSRVATTSATGEFALDVIGDDSDVRVRAVVPYVRYPLGMYDSESEIPPIPAETTIDGAVPGGGPVEVRMYSAPLVYIELAVPEGETALGHLQIEGLVFDEVSNAWGRLGGPAFRRAAGTPPRRRMVIALPRAEANRPLVLWSWGGWGVSGVDPRGLDRVSVAFHRGRWAGVRGKGWRETDRIRVVGFLGPNGREVPSIWIDSVLGKTDHWSRTDAPVSAIEFQIVRDGVVVGRSERVPPGAGAADEARIDLE